jgi:hypothetical protein
MAIERALFAEMANRRRDVVPEGFRYALVKSRATLDLKPFEFHGRLGNRRVISFGLRYD